MRDMNEPILVYFNHYVIDDVNIAISVVILSKKWRVRQVAFVKSLNRACVTREFRTRAWQPRLIAPSAREHESVTYSRRVRMRGHISLSLFLLSLFSFFFFANHGVFFASDYIFNRRSLSMRQRFRPRSLSRKWTHEASFRLIFVTVRVSGLRTFPRTRQPIPMTSETLVYCPARCRRVRRRNRVRELASNVTTIVRVHWTLFLLFCRRTTDLLSAGLCCLCVFLSVCAWL